MASPRIYDHKKVFSPPGWTIIAERFPRCTVRRRIGDFDRPSVNPASMHVLGGPFSPHRVAAVYGAGVAEFGFIADN
jgi:hypothetical protein